MRPTQVIFLVLFPTFFLSLNTSCAHNRSHQSTQNAEAPSPQIFLRPGPAFESETFQARWSGPVSEKDKIRYLLDRIGNSRQRFFRNGNLYDGNKARQWFLFKISRYVKDAGTAQSFVDRVATFSMKTGEPYLVELEDGKRYPLGSILANELAAFENYLGAIQNFPAGSLPQLRPVSVTLFPATATSKSRTSR